VVAHELLEAGLREDERDPERLATRVPDADLDVARNVDRRAGTHRRFTTAERGHAGAAVDEEDLVRDQVRVRLDLGAGRDVLVPHHEVGGVAIPAVHLENEWPLPGIAAYAAFALALLKDEPGPSRARVVGG